MTKATPGGILVSWLAYNNDPYQTTNDGQRIPGPTLCFLFDEASPYRGKVGDAVFFLRRSVDEAQREGDREPRIYRQIKHEIDERTPDLEVDHREWFCDDPTDHERLYAFLKEELPRLRTRFAGRPLYIHISPGTPAMQTMWVLMVETGLVDEPVTMVKTLRPWKREGGPAAVPVELNLDTLLKTFRRSRPAETAPDEESAFWDPSRFRSERLRNLYGRAKRLAQLNVPVLILGERGTGKTTLASWIRLNSPYRDPDKDGAWPSVACGQYSGDTIRSELFGHEEGAFTGAEHPKEGLLQQADGDTLFLDEIGDITQEVQRLLIRAVEEGRFLPLGASEPVESTFRLLTATNRPWGTLQEHLDPDFLDRVSLFKLRLPPLREIPEDIPWLWETVYEEALRRSGQEAIVEPLPEDGHHDIVERLRAHPLPGNIRDLFRVAYQLIAARLAIDEQTSPLDAEASVEYAVRHGLDAEAQAEDGVARSIAAAFANGEPLDGVVKSHGYLPLQEVQRHMNRYVAGELLRIARQDGRSVDELCDKAERTLYSWLK